MVEKIITHNDFDGLVSAVICSYALGVDYVQFAGPRTVSNASISITLNDVVCDLPYPLECGMWFDHHEGNLEELRYRNIDPSTIPGRFDAKDSCARVVFEYFSEKDPLPAHFESMVIEADIIDTFNYASIEDWRRETPGKVIDGTIKLQQGTSKDKWQYLRNILIHLKTRPMEEVAAMPSVRQRFKAFQQEEKEMLAQIEKDVSFLPQDKDHELIVLDLTHHNRQPHVIKNLAYLLYPRAKAVIEVKSMFRRGVKSNDLAFSMSLSLNLNMVKHHKDVGEIMRSLNIGSGHLGAGAGTIACNSRDEMKKTKERTLTQILRMLQNQ